jgi:hypothetical protein
MLHLLAGVPLVDWPPRPTTDAGELVLVAITLVASLGIMVVFGQWWQR